jgi:hypothetical protein
MISIEDIRDEFNWYFKLATEGSVFPNNAVIIPKIQAAADLIFIPEFIHLDHLTFANELLKCISERVICIDTSNSSREFIV